MKTAIITGASAGLGKEFFRAVCAKYKEIEEIWLIARRENLLNELKDEVPEKRVRIFALDITKKESIAAIQNALKEAQAQLTLLINNAGVGALGEVYGADFERQMAMSELNNGALCGLTAAVLPFMNEGAKIINVCSIASFAPNPRMTVYSATKAFVMFYSRSLRFELKKRKINVLALCPGPMRTEFLSVANITGNSKAFDKLLPYVDPKKAVDGALKASDKNRAVHTPKAFYKLYRVLAKILPKEWIMPVSKT